MSVLEAISKSWIEKVDAGLDFKKDRFQDYADDAMKFYDGPLNFLYTKNYLQKSHGFVGNGNIAVPRIQVGINKLFELVTLYLPTLLHQNPQRTVTPNRPRLPDSVRQVIAMTGQMPPDADLMKTALADAKSFLLHTVLNRTPYELNLKLNSRYALTEALLKGRGLLWTEIRRMGNRIVPGSFFDSVDHLVVDPDAEWLANCGWVSRRRVRPVQEAEDLFGLQRGTLKGNRESVPTKYHYDRQDVFNDVRYQKQRTADLIEYHEIYSRMGMGGRLYGSQTPLSDTLESYGKNCYLAVARNIPFPLNLPPDTVPDPSEVRRRVSWPIPVYDDPTHPWPFANCDFAIKPRETWPVAWIKPAMGLQKLLAWAYSFLASHAQVSTRQLLMVPKDIEEDVETAILEGTDFELLKVRRDHRGTFENVVEFVKHPEVNGDLITLLSAVERAFEKATGLIELMYGNVGPTQMRSAEEASVRQQHTMLRPDDLADTTEDFMSLAARNEAVAWRTLATPRDVAPLFGEKYDDSNPFDPVIGPYSSLWATLLNGSPLDEVLYEFEYRIESGSARKPNKVKQRQDVDESAQVLLSTLFGDYQQWGDPSMLNAWFSKWCDSRDFDPGMIQFPDRRKQMMAQMLQSMQQQQMQQQGQPPQGGEGKGGGQQAPPQGSSPPPGGPPSPDQGQMMAPPGGSLPPGGGMLPPGMVGAMPPGASPGMMQALAQAGLPPEVAAMLLQQQQPIGI